MANDLVRWHGPGGDGYGRFSGDDTEDDGEQWDTPPDQPTPAESNSKTLRRTKNGYNAQAADQDAAEARRRGDTTFAALREIDAAENRQSTWDWGDFRTWAIIFGMCAAYLLMSALIYFLPHGRHNQNDGPNPRVFIRVY